MSPITPTEKPTPKMLREACSRLEFVVGAQNLYRGPHRFIYPRVIDGKLTVENLATNKRVPFRNDGSFHNTWGTKIVLNELPKEEPAPSLNDVVSSHLASHKLVAREVGSGPTFEWSGLASPELIEALQHNDVDVRAFKSDNPGHEDFGRECIAFTVFGTLACQAQSNAAPLPQPKPATDTAAKAR